MSKTIEVSDETWAKIKDQVEGEGGKEINNYEDMIGEKFYFRTVTYACVGEIKKVVGRFVQLKNASWIADTGRFSDFIKIGPQTSSEIEPVGEQFLNMDTVVDFFPWKHSLPSKQQ
jgi:hypothetical protein